MEEKWELESPFLLVEQVPRTRNPPHLSSRVHFHPFERKMHTSMPLSTRVCFIFDPLGGPWERLLWRVASTHRISLFQWTRLFVASIVHASSYSLDSTHACIGCGTSPTVFHRPSRIPSRGVHVDGSDLGAVPRSRTIRDVLVVSFSPVFRSQSKGRFVSF